MRVSVVVPVRDGARWIGPLLDALRREGPDETLIIDSGSRDGSRDIARAAPGVRLIELTPADFGHGRTRNLAVRETSGDLVCFLTQDALPVEGWLEAYRAAFRLPGAHLVGAAFGPHLPRPGTPARFARGLADFWTGLDLDDQPRIVTRGERPFLSNANACYRRECLTEHPFPEVEYGEDNALAQLLEQTRWRRAWQPAAAVEHVHEEPLLTMARRTFDDALLAHRLTGYVEPGARPAELVRDARRQSRFDRAWGATRGDGDSTPFALARSTAHHALRKVAAVAGTRPDALPAPLARRLSLHVARVRGR